MHFPAAALERAMKVRDVIVRAIAGQYSWLQAADILGMSPRSVRRWRWRMERHGYAGLIDKRRGVPSPRRARVEEIRRIVDLYRGRYSGFNCRHFHQVARQEHDVKLSYSLVKQVLQGAGLIKKGRGRGRHRRRREPRACLGELLHLDGSHHHWLALRPEEKQTLIAVVDDATKRLVYAQLEASESTEAVMAALREVVQRFGVPQALYTDRASWAFLTPTCGGSPDRERLTQVGRALRLLGVQHIPSFSPQARGRSERANRTLQGRLVNELRVAGIADTDTANRYLRERFIPEYDRVFGRPPASRDSGFTALGRRDLEQIFCHEEERVVGRDNVVVLGKIRLQIGKQPGRRTCAGAHVYVRRHLDGTHSVWLATRRLGRYDENGRPMDAAGPVENRKGPRFPTRTLDGRQTAAVRPQRPQVPAAANL